ncbi:MAG: PAS domain S-box protein, partial [Calditrichaeota bacterium]
MHAKGKTKDELLDEIQQLRSTIATLKEAREAFLQSTRDEILVIRSDYTIQFANRHFRGLRPEKIVGRSCFELLDQHEAQKFKEILSSVFSDATVCECELSFGEQVYAARVSPIRENGQVASALVVARDLTDFKQTERALRESEARYRDLLERVPDGIYRSTPEGKFLMVNSALVRMLGYETHEELLKIDIPSELYFDPEERKEAQDRLTHQQQQSHIIRLRRKDGSTLWVEDHGRLEYDNQGKPLYFEGVLRDVTASRKVEVELKKSEQRYRMLIQRMHEGLMQVDNDDVIQFVNDRFCELTGYSREELLGQVAHQLLLRDEDHEFLKSKIRQRLQRKHDEYELRMRKKSGEFIWVHTSGTPIFDERGEVVGSLGIHTDITQRKRMEEALQKSQERYRSFFDGDLSADFVSTPDGRLLDCNQAFVEMFGFSSKEEALNTNAKLLYPEESSRLEYIKLLQQQREIHNYERELVKLDGSRIHVVSNIKGIFNEQDELVEIRGYIFDITEKKQAEALSSAQKQILELIAGDVSLSVVLDTLCLTIEKNAPGSLCSIMLVDESGQSLRCGAAPSLPKAYAAALEGILVADNAGSCGTAAFLGKQVVVTNVESDPRWENYRELARTYGIRACWSTPFFSKSGKVLGTFAISHKTPCSPSAFHEELMKTASHLAGIAVEHAHSEEALRRSEQRFRDLFDNAPDM